LRGGKASTWEGGVRVPAIAMWPGKIVPKSVSDAVAGTIDLMPTCMTIAGGKVPAEPVIDGRDLSPVLFGQSKESSREAHYYFSNYTLHAVRQGPWKLVLLTEPDLPGQEPAADTKTNPRLYNLDKDIGETTNVADMHPEVVAKLKALAVKMNAEIGGKAPTARRPAGVVSSPKQLYPFEEEPKAKDKAKKPPT
jgi:arylsulfatase A-like enzyme